MALINNIYVFIEDEDISRDTEISQHPVEKGLPTTDIVRAKPKSISISGKIVDIGSTTAATIIEKIEKLRTSGSLIDYKGRNICGNYQIKSFNTSHPNTVWGGAKFDMELVEVRIAKSAYNPKKSTKTQSGTEKKKSNPNLNVGGIVVFKGGSVYISSDAKKATSTRERSTCKITKTNIKSWSIHQYHLISTDGKKVYGWVDKANIEGTGNTGTSAVTNGGTQQVKKKTTTKKTTTKTTTKSTTKSNNETMATKNFNLEKVGTLNKLFIVGSETYLNQNTITVGNAKYYLKNNWCYPLSYVISVTYDGGRSKGKGFPKGTPYYRRVGLR